VLRTLHSLGMRIVTDDWQSEYVIEDRGVVMVTDHPAHDMDAVFRSIAIGTPSQLLTSTNSLRGDSRIEYVPTMEEP
jgi:hypothetical protein